MLVLAHRGFHRHVPENSMAAFAAAVELMVDGIETDIRFSQDDAPVLFHDTLARNGQAVADLTHSQLEQITGFAVPTVDQALGRWPALIWNLEIKAPAAAAKIAEVLKPWQKSHRLLLTSFDHQLVSRLAELLKADCGLLFDERSRNIKSYLSRYAEQSGIGTIVVDYKILNETLVHDARSLGMRTLAYGAVSRQDHARCVALDLAGVITDYPDRIPPRVKPMKSALIISLPGKSLRLAQIDLEATGDYKSKDQARKRLDELHKEFALAQEMLYAEGKQSLLIIFQAMDTGGKDGAIQNLFEGIDPSGLHITAFKAPTPEELKHDFLWRIHKAAPAKGMIAVWNRSHYEDVLIVRVKNLVEKKVWEAGYAQINDFEKLLADNRVTLLKFYLHISKDEQKERLQARLDDPEKIWKFNPGDLPERARWDDYQSAYQDAINRCTTEQAPWYIVPANKKWSRDVCVMEAVVAALKKMAPQFPKPAFDPKSIVIE